MFNKNLPSEGAQELYTSTQKLILDGKISAVNMYPLINLMAQVYLEIYRNTRIKVHR